MNDRRMYAAAMAAMLLMLLSGCGGTDAPKETVQLVKTIEVGAGDTSMAGVYAGTVRGRYESNLSFQAGGRITARNVQLGSIVHAGDVLMTVDPKDIAQSVQQAQAQVDAAQAQMQLAQANLGRYRQLFSQDAVSAAALDQYQTAYDQAQAQYNQAQAVWQAQQNQLSYTALTADADGVISSVYGEVGQVAAAGQTMLTLVHNGDWEIEIHVPENRLADVPVGKEVAISFWAIPDQTCRGVVREVAPVADAASRTYGVRISVPEPPSSMQLGMTASVSAGSGSKSSSDTCVLPLSALYQTGDTPQEWVVGKDNILVLQPVSVEAFGDDTVTVRGLSQGENVVAAGTHMLHEGQKVRTEGGGI